MVMPSGAAFIGQHSEQWCQVRRINLAMSAEYAETALAGLKERWRLYGTSK